MVNNNELQQWRDTLNIIDESIILLLGQRYKICRKVGEFKKQNHISMLQPDRISDVINRCILLGKKADVPEALIKKIYKLIIKTACTLEMDIIDN